MFLLHFSKCKKSYIFFPFLLMENGNPLFELSESSRNDIIHCPKNLLVVFLKNSTEDSFFFLSFCFSLQLHDFKTGAVFLWDLIWTQCDYLDTRIHIFIVKREFSAKTSNRWTKAFTSEAKCKEMPKISNQDKPCFNAICEKNKNWAQASIMNKMSTY